MATLTLDRSKLRANHRALAERMPGGVRWGVVSKLLCGDETFLNELLALEPAQVLDARLEHLERVRALRPDVPTGYIKPSAPDEAPRVVRAADLSFVSEPRTLRALDEAAAELGLHHEVVLMVELGDLREGLPRDRVAEVAGVALACDHLRLVGLGANLNCLNGVMPSEDKLAQLELLREIVELRHGVRLPLLSAGTSVTLPLLFAGGVPAAINHFRVGETLFFGRDLLRDRTFTGLHDDVFVLEARVLEAGAKPVEPYGEVGERPFGGGAASGAPAPRSGRTARRALLDVGRLDVDPSALIPLDDGVAVVDGSSDMTVVDVDAREPVTRAGDTLRFRLRYRGALTLLNSPYVAKRVTDGPVVAPAAAPVAAPRDAAAGD